MSIKERIDSRLAYKTRASRMRYLQQYDNWGPDAYKYLRQNSENRAIIPVGSVTLSQVGKKSMAIDFVVDAFSDMRQHYRNKVNTGLNPYLDMQILEVERAYVPASSLFSEHMKRVENIFYEQYLFPDEVENFDQYMREMRRFLFEMLPRTPLMFSSYVNSNICPINVTGCYLELEVGGHNDDQKRERCLNHPSFNFFARLANEYGFVVPMHAPWCLVANLNSPKMLSYAVQYDIENRGQIESEYFSECKNHDIDLFKKFIFDVYDRFQNDSYNISKIKTCPSGKIIRETTTREQMLTEDMLNYYPPKFWFKTYIEMKFYELNKNDIYTAKRLDNLIEDCYDIFQRYGFNQAFGYAEMKIFKIRRDRLR